MTRSYQDATLLKNTLYELKKLGLPNASEALAPRITIKGGEATIYGSDTDPASLGDMLAIEIGVTGYKAFESIPNFLYVEETTPTITEIVITGIKATPDSF